MASDKLKLFTLVLKIFIPYGFKLLYQKLQAVNHRWTYKDLPTAQNVVVIGGSFAGLALARRLIDTLPTGYKVIMIEKNSHFNFSWVFPRFAVVTGHEEKAFIPYDGVGRGAPVGIWRHVCDSVTRVTATHVYLASGEEIEYAFLAIATGASQPVPAKVLATESREGCAELRTVQQNIRNAARIAVLGGGAVGIEIASDIKSFFPAKDVTLFHSRSQLLPTFQHRLHDYVAEAFEKLGIRIVYEERPQILPGQRSLRTSTGVEEFDLIIPCTGQRPNSAIIEELAADAISKETRYILVKPTLQIDDDLPHIFALGDVAETGGPKMSRACQAQAEIVGANILDIIEKRSPSVIYTPQLVVEGAIKLTLGKMHHVVYAQEGDRDGSDLMVPGKGGREDLGIDRAWWWMGAKYKA
ncbi:oxidoreductase [Mycena epipterygia]|nr:oxidoreductase [Mycena epipterygia]